MHYFGTWDNWQAALNKYNADGDYLDAGETPPTTATTVADILNAFLGEKEAAFREGDITKRSYSEYESVCDTIAAPAGGQPLG